jgi:hypothetical protein
MQTTKQVVGCRRIRILFAPSMYQLPSKWDSTCDQLIINQSILARAIASAIENSTNVELYFLDSSQVNPIIANGLAISVINCLSESPNVDPKNLQRARSLIPTRLDIFP